jgi:hypothetical protein
MKIRNNQMILQWSFRTFAPPPVKKGGPPAASTPAPPKPKVIPPLQKMVNKGHEFILGPPFGLNKTRGGHRDGVAPKLEPRIEAYAKKLRELYIKDGVIPDYKEYLDIVRDRQPEDTMEKLMENKMVPGKRCIYKVE